MRLYHVSTSTRIDRQYELANVLVCFETRRRAVSQVLSAREAERRVILDCGAFGALTRGRPINLSEYIATCHAVRHAVDFYAALDVIGDADASFNNWRTMVAAGLTDATPTFHAGTALSGLDRILAEGPAYIGLGGLVGRARSEREAWLDEVWAHLVKHVRWPLKVHGWGQTDPPVMVRYPWTSVDSSYVIRERKFGSRWKLPDGRIVSRHSRGVLVSREAREKLDHIAELATEKWASFLGQTP